METIVPADAKAQTVEVKQSETVKYHIIGADSYSKWFTLGFDDANASPKCGISSVVVKDYSGDTVMTSGSAFVNEHQELMISLKDARKNNVVKLVATTRGGQISEKEIVIIVRSKDDDSFTSPCQYSVDPTEGVIVTQTDVPNLKVEEWKAAFDK